MTPFNPAMRTRTQMVAPGAKPLRLALPPLNRPAGFQFASVLGSPVQVRTSLMLGCRAGCNFACVTHLTSRFARVVAENEIMAKTKHVTVRRPVVGCIPWLDVWAHEPYRLSHQTRPAHATRNQRMAERRMIHGRKYRCATATTPRALRKRNRRP